MSPDNSRVLVGGSFSTLNGVAAYGMGAARRSVRRDLALGRAGAHPLGRAQRCDHDAEDRRQSGLRRRLRVRRGCGLRRNLCCGPEHRCHQLGERLPGRHLRHLRPEPGALLGRPHAQLQRDRWVPRHQPAIPLAEGHRRPHPAHGDDHQQGRLRLGLHRAALRGPSPVVPGPRVRQLHRRSPGGVVGLGVR